MFTILDLQNMLSVSARNAKSSGSYSYYQKDLALFQAMELWRRLTKQTRRLDTVALTIANSAVPSLPTGFSPEFDLSVYLTLSGKTITPDLRIVPYQELLTAQADNWSPSTNTNPPTSGQPYLMAFQTPSTAFLYPTPDQSYTLNFWWWADVATWTLGQAFVAANLSGGAIASFSINVAGSIYGTAPTITVTDSVGTGFVCGAVTVSSGGVATIAVTSGGSGYVNPTVFINGVSASFPVMNLTNEALLPIATQLAVYYLQASEPANSATAQAALAAGELEAKRFAARGAGSLGVQTIDRAPPAWAQQGVYGNYYPNGVR